MDDMFYLRKLNLTNFRCYEKDIFEFGKKRNILIGSNAAGKTTLVEAIHLLGLAKSFKPIKDIGLIKKGESYYNVKGEFYHNDDTIEIMASYNSVDKRITKNQIVYRNISDHLGLIKIVLFSPDDLNLVKGAPLERRKFLDQNIGQINQGYLLSLIRFKKILKERNEFLKTSDYNNYNKELLEVITQGLIKEASTIIKAREVFVNTLNPIIKDISLVLSKGEEIASFVYNPNCIVDKLWKKAEERLSYDFLMKTTTWGPTRDDIDILLNGDNAVTYCSQGQIRSITLAAKLALANLFIKDNDKLIIILDDVLSELDKNRQEQVLKLINKDIQTFITTTSIDNINADIVNDSNVLEIRKGE